MLVFFDLGDDWEVSFLVCDDVCIVDLNVEFCEKLIFINVFLWFLEECVVDEDGGNFDLFEGLDFEFGDIVIVYDICVCEFEVVGKLMYDYVMYLLVYGVLYLLGYDYICDKDVVFMEGLEVEIFGKLGLSNLYYEG